tara:strand:- start:15759 stop:17840 length:2082 start_codon:yes stop_codon:yes gene_type:complete
MKKIYLNLVLLLMSGFVMAQVDRSVMPEAGPVPKIDLGETQSFTLENGLKVFVVENHKLPQVAFSLQLDIDPIKEGDKTGTADIAGDLLSKGTKNRTKDELNFEVDFIGARFFTSATSIFASSLKKHQTKLLEIMADAVKNSEFKEEELAKLKKQYISGIQTEKDDPDAIARNVRKVLLYGKNHPYGEISTEETIENITLEDATNYYQTYFKPNVSYLAVVGDIDLKEAKTLIEKYFGDWKKEEVPTHTYDFPEKPKMTQVAFVNKPGAVQSVVSVFNTIDLQPGSEDAIKASITNGILGGGFVSKLNLNLREEHSYTYGAGSSINSDELVGSFTASAKVRNEVTDSALKEMMDELMNMRKGEITEDELKTIKNYQTGTFAIGLENPQTKARFAINIEKYNLSPDYYANYLKNIAAVTLEDVKEISNKYIKPMNGYILIVGNQEEVAEKIKQLSPTGGLNFYDSYGNEARETTLEPAPEGMTAEKVIQAYIEKIGGEKALSKITSLKKEMAVSVQGMSMSLTESYVQPNKYKSAITAGPQVVQKVVYNGVEGQTVTMRGKELMEKDQLNDMKYETMIFPELAYLNSDFKLELKGIDTKFKEETYVVEVVSPSGKKHTDYYSVKTGYKVADESIEPSEMGDLQEVTVYSDYKAVKKVQFPHKMVSSQGPMKFEVDVNEVKLNDKIDASEFEIEK